MPPGPRPMTNTDGGAINFFSSSYDHCLYYCIGKFLSVFAEIFSLIKRHGCKNGADKNGLWLVIHRFIALIINRMPPPPLQKQTPNKLTFWRQNKTSNTVALGSNGNGIKTPKRCVLLPESYQRRRLSFLQMVFCINLQLD